MTSQPSWVGLRPGHWPETRLILLVIVTVFACLCVYCLDVSITSVHKPARIPVRKTRTKVLNGIIVMPRKITSTKLWPLSGRQEIPTGRGCHRVAGTNSSGLTSCSCTVCTFMRAYESQQDSIRSLLSPFVKEMQRRSIRTNLCHYVSFFISQIKLSFPKHLETKSLVRELP